MLKLGRKPKTEDKRDLLLRNYIDLTVLPPIPDQFGHESLIANWQMLGNGPDPSVFSGFDGAGDCTFAGGGHETMLWTAEGSTPAVITGANTISDYSALTGYNPKTGANDDGAEIRDVLKYRQTVGLIDSKGVRHKIGAFLALDTTNMAEIYAAMYLFSACELGINFPAIAMTQFNSGKPWDVVANDGGIEGGHDIPLVCKRSNMACVTWAKLQQMTLAFFQKYCDEAWVILSTEFLKNGISPEGFDLAQLQTDLANIQNAPPSPVTPTIISITVTPATATISVGAPVQLKATATMSDGSTQDVTSTCNWQSANQDLATVGAGLVTGVSAGPVKILATSGTVGGSAAITVTPSNQGCLSFVVGKTLATFFGKATQQDVAPSISATGHLMVELTPLVKALGGTVAWNASTQTATVSGLTPVSLISKEMTFDGATKVVQELFQTWKAEQVPA